MKHTVKTLLGVSFVFLATLIANAQDKTVRVLKFEVDGKVVKTKFRVDFITDDKKIYKGRTDKRGFIVAAEVIAKTVGKTLGVVIKFKKYNLLFSAVHSSNFEADWTIGVDSIPFEPENLGGSDSSDILAIYYLEFAGEPGRRMTVKVERPQITIQKINED